MERKEQKLELLSPAGDPERLDSALRFGAGAVYLAGREFGMRAGPANFSNEELKKACLFAHEKGAKVYVTCNTLPRNGEIERLPGFLEAVEDAGADGLIVTDLGVLALAKRYAPRTEVHISTQAGIVNYQSARAFYDLGASRVVLARELSLEEIAEIRAKTDPKLELETFVHGSMCVSFSGRCLLSNYLTGRDANRGDCAQPCRWKYHLMEESRPGEYFPVLEEDSGAYFFNSRDLCMIEHIPELVNAGIDSFKIEGRMKTALYVAVVSRTYRQAIDDYFEDPQKYIDNIPYYKKEIAKCTYRQFTTGFFFGPTTHDSQIYDNNTYVKGYEYLGTIHESLEDGRGVFEQKNKFSVGDEVEIMKPTGENIVTKVLSMQDEKGENVDSCPHPGQRITLQTECTLQEYDIIRKEKEVSGDECEGGSACHS